MNTKLAVLFVALVMIIGGQARSYQDDFDNSHREQEQYRRALYQLMDAMMERRGTPMDDLVSFFDNTKGDNIALKVGQSLEQIGKAMQDYVKTGNKADETTFRNAVQQYATYAQEDGKLVDFMQKFFAMLHSSAGRR